jgi:hypothetical protein
MQNNHSRITLVLVINPDLLRDFGEFCNDQQIDVNQGVTLAIEEAIGKRRKPKAKTKVKKRGARRS